MVGCVAKASRRSRDERNKSKAEIEESDCVIVYTSVCNGRVSRRLCGSTTKGQETGKLGSQMFEIYIEYDCHIFCMIVIFLYGVYIYYLYLLLWMM